jgi:hypothetical protein
VDVDADFHADVDVKVCVLYCTPCTVCMMIALLCGESGEKVVEGGGWRNSALWNCAIVQLCSCAIKD